MKIHIMQEDISGAKRNDWEQCPLARALNRIYPGNDVEVFDDRIYINGHLLNHTDDTESFVLAFNEGAVRPIELDAPNFFDFVWQSEEEKDAP